MSALHVFNRMEGNDPGPFCTVCGLEESHKNHVGALHTLNGRPVPNKHHLYEFVKSIVTELASEYPRSAAAIRNVVKEAEQCNTLRAALGEAVALIDEERAGTKSGWSHEDNAKLERLRALVKFVAVPYLPWMIAKSRGENG